MPNLIIVESPAKAKTIKKYLGGKYKVVASMGHIRDLPKSQLGIDVENDFEPKYISIRGKSKLINSLKKDAKEAKKVYLATDPDREGEAISWHLSSLLELDESNSARVIFNEITKNAVQNGIKNPRAIDMNLVDAQQARRVLDRLVGYKISPFLWRKVKKGLSAGRVQSVATKLIVDREKEIENFKEVEYWTIDANLLKGETKFSAKFYGDEKKKIVPANEKEASEIANAADGAAYSVGDVKKAKKKRHPAPPFITSTLQQEASRKLSFTAKKTMQLAQELYEGIEISGHGLVGLITYMRTDSLRVSDDSVKAARAFASSHFGEDFIPSKPRYYKSSKNAQDAHVAITPTDFYLSPEVVKKSLGKDQFKLYKLIWDRFVASQMSDMILDTVAADINCAGKNGKKYIFRATGSVVVFSGFAAIYEEGKDEKNEEEGKLPELSSGDSLKFESLEKAQHFTQPPARYSEATLIKALEENGIGRPSTYAPTITTILNREYVVKEGKTFRPTALGTVTTDLMLNSFGEIVDIEFTAKMESELDRVEEGSLEWKKLIEGFYKGFEKTLKTAEEKLEGVYYKVPDEVTEEICELCGKNMIIKNGKFGKFLACPGYPTCKNTKPLISDTGGICPKCGGRIIRRRSKNGNKFYGCEKQGCDFMTWYEPTGKLCPQCGKTLLGKNNFKKEVICSNEGCSYTETAKKND